MKQFKTVKIRKRKKIVKIIFAFFFFFSYVFAFKYCAKNKLKKSVLNENINYIPFNINKVISSKINNVINKPTLLLNDNIKKVKAVKVDKPVEDEKKNDVSVKKQNVSKASASKPIIYIYNTHQGEEYNGYSIYEASANFSNKLNNNGISTIFEEQSVGVFLEQNNLKYYKSYDVTKNFIKKAINEYPSLKYFIDFHRDSVGKGRSTVTYNDKSYAKILFLVGLENTSYSVNLNNANILNDIIKSKVPNISRGIMEKKGKGVNGVYNQDISGNLFLIEVGGKDNTKEEVENSMNVIYDSLIQYIGDRL